MNKVTYYTTRMTQWLMRGVVAFIMIPLMFVVAVVWWLLSLIITSLITGILFLTLNSDRNTYDAELPDNAPTKKNEKKRQTNYWNKRWLTAGQMSEKKNNAP